VTGPGLPDRLFGKPVELGRGAMGITYKAFDVDLRCPVALKVISERYLGDEWGYKRDAAMGRNKHLVASSGGYA
jgi:hypothetical protein